MDDGGEWVQTALNAPVPGMRQWVRQTHNIFLAGLHGIASQQPAGVAVECNGVSAEDWSVCAVRWSLCC